MRTHNNDKILRGIVASLQECVDDYPEGSFFTMSVGNRITCTHKQLIICRTDKDEFDKVDQYLQSMGQIKGETKTA